MVQVKKKLVKDNINKAHSHSEVDIVKQYKIWRRKIAITLQEIESKTNYKIEELLDYPYEWILAKLYLIREVELLHLKNDLIIHGYPADKVRKISLEEPAKNNKVTDFRWAKDIKQAGFGYKRTAKKKR